jgi:hypothetical protein
VRAERSRPASGDRSMCEHGGGVARTVGMVGHPGRVRSSTTVGQQCGQDAAMQVGPATGTKRPLHRQAGQLVPETDAAGLALEHPGRDALIHLGR